MAEEEIVKWAVAGVEFIISVAEKVGHRDPVLTALDALFSAARQRNREDLTAKRRTHPPDPLHAAASDPKTTP